MKWKVWYSDGTTATDRDDDVFSVPGRNVQIVAQDDQHVGREMLHSTDWYWWEDGRWLGGDIHGMVDYLSRPGHKKVLMGRMIPNLQWDGIMRTALLDDYINAKTARLSREKLP
jgi:hypothetical protein